MLQCKPEDEQHMYQLILTAGNLVSRTLEVILIALSGPVLESYLGFRLLSNRWFQLVPRKAGSLCFIHGAPGVPGLGAAPTKLQETCLNPCNLIDAGAISASNNVRKWITWTEKAEKANVHLYLERKKKSKCFVGNTRHLHGAGQKMSNKGAGGITNLSAIFPNTEKAFYRQK